MKYFLIQVFLHEYLGFYEEELANACDDEESFLEDAESHAHTEVGLHFESIERALSEDTARTQLARALGYSSMTEYADVQSESGEISISIEVTEVSEAYARAHEIEKLHG